jgi:hypothetical protein
MIVEEKGKNRRLIDIAGKVVTEFQFDWFFKNIADKNPIILNKNLTKKLLFDLLIEFIGVNGKINLE